MVPRAVGPNAVYLAASSLGGFDHRRRLTLPEVSHAIARSATIDPIWPDELAGAEATASMLLAIAWEASRISPYTRQGSHLGMYRMRPPLDPPLEASMLILPEPSTLLAIDRARMCLEASAIRRRPISESLGLFREMGRTEGAFDLRTARLSPGSQAWGQRVVALMRRLFRERLGPKEDEYHEQGTFVHKWRGTAKQRDREMDLLGPARPAIRASGDPPIRKSGSADHRTTGSAE